MSGLELHPDEDKNDFRRAGRWWRALFGVLLVAGCISAGLISGSLGSQRAVASSSLPGPVDIGFCQAMIIHHQQAVTMVQDIGLVPVATLRRSLLASKRTN